MPARLLMRVFIAASVAAVLGGLTFVYVWPPGEAIPLEVLVNHYKGGGR